VVLANRAARARRVVDRGTGPSGGTAAWLDLGASPRCHWLVITICTADHMGRVVRRAARPGRSEAVGRGHRPNAPPPGAEWANERPRSPDRKRTLTINRWPPPSPPSTLRAAPAAGMAGAAPRVR